jgi:hypothetical protein
MIEYGDKCYAIDINALEKFIEMKPTKVTPKDVKTTVTKFGDGKVQTITEEFIPFRPTEVNSVRHSLITEMLDVLLDKYSDSEDEEDLTLGADRALSKKSFSLKLAFNTLNSLNILIEL